MCSGCFEVRPRATYSRWQWQHVAEGTRRCMICGPRGDAGTTRRAVEHARGGSGEGGGKRGIRVATLHVCGLFRREGGTMMQVEHVRMRMDVDDIDVMVLTGDFNAVLEPRRDRQGREGRVEPALTGVDRCLAEFLTKDLLRTDDEGSGPLLRDAAEVWTENPAVLEAAALDERYEAHLWSEHLEGVDDDTQGSSMDGQLDRSGSAKVVRALVEWKQKLKRAFAFTYKSVAEHANAGGPHAARLDRVYVGDGLTVKESGGRD